MPPQHAFLRKNEILQNYHQKFPNLELLYIKVMFLYRILLFLGMTNFGGYLVLFLVLYKRCIKNLKL